MTSKPLPGRESGTSGEFTQPSVAWRTLSLLPSFYVYLWTCSDLCSDFWTGDTKEFKRPFQGIQIPFQAAFLDSDWSKRLSCPLNTLNSIKWKAQLARVMDKVPQVFNFCLTESLPGYQGRAEHLSWCGGGEQPGVLESRTQLDAVLSKQLVPLIVLLLREFTEHSSDQK